MRAQRHSVVTLAGCGMIIQRIFLALVPQHIGKPVQSQIRPVLVEHIGHLQHDRVLMFLPPLVKGRGGVDLPWHALLEKPQHRLITPQATRPTQLLLDQLQVRLHLLHPFQKPALPAQATAHHPFPQKNPVRRLGIHPPVMHAPARHHRQAATDHRLFAIHRTLRLIPVRLAILAHAQMRRHLLDPFRFDARHPPRPQARGLHQLHP